MRGVVAGLALMTLAGVAFLAVRGDAEAIAVPAAAVSAFFLGRIDSQG